jgi:hypothetical protein
MATPVHCQPRGARDMRNTTSLGTTRRSSRSSAGTACRPSRPAADAAKCMTHGASRGPSGVSTPWRKAEGHICRVAIARHGGTLCGQRPCAHTDTSRTEPGDPAVVCHTAGRPHREVQGTPMMGVRRNRRSPATSAGPRGYGTRIRSLRVAPTTSMPAVPRMPSSGIVSVYFRTCGRQIGPGRKATTSISQ